MDEPHFQLIWRDQEISWPGCLILIQALNRLEEFNVKSDVSLEELHILLRAAEGYKEKLQQWYIQKYGTIPPAAKGS